jgi:DNA-binding MarR family transcriptional regulator
MEQVGRSGLTQRQFTVLLAIDQNDGVSQTQLVKLTGIDRSTLADLVARLLSQGYLQRRRAKNDGRTNAVRITAAGKKALKNAVPGADEVDKALLAEVPPAHRKSFFEALGILAAALEAQEKEGKAREHARSRRGR